MAIKTGEKSNINISKRSLEACRMLGPVGITAGLTTFFFGLASKYNWTDIYAGIILIVIGFVLLVIYLLTLK